MTGEITERHYNLNMWRTGSEKLQQRTSPSSGGRRASAARVFSSCLCLVLTKSRLSATFSPMVVRLYLMFCDFEARACVKGTGRKGTMVHRG